MYVTIEELAENLSVSVSSIRGWLKAGYFSQEAYFNVNSVYRFKLEQVIEELHSGNFKERASEEISISAEAKSAEAIGVSTILLDEYKYLAAGLFSIISSNFLLPNNMAEKLQNFEHDFNSEYSFDYGNSVLLDATSILRHYNLDEVLTAIRHLIISHWSDDEDRRTLLDKLGIFNDISKIQAGMLDKLNKYLKYENNFREKLLTRMGADYETLNSVLSDEEKILEEVQDLLVNASEGITANREQFEMIYQMRKSLFGNIYDFETGSFKSEVIQQQHSSAED
jgi:hypothetical protein